VTRTTFDGNRNSAKDFRTSTASTKVTEVEIGELERAATTRGMRLGEWIREVLLREAQSPSDPVSPEALLTEIIGLQLFLTHVLQPVACGEQMSPHQYEQLMQQVRVNKHLAARAVIAHHIAEKKEPVHD
jgi:hypothetical protein